MKIVDQLFTDYAFRVAIIAATLLARATPLNAHKALETALDLLMEAEWMTDENYSCSECHLANR
jgi:hypothetical protein